MRTRLKEAQVAIEVGKVFDTEKTIINYENLGIGRLIYQLPTTLLRFFFLRSSRRTPSTRSIRETLFTINKFFENNLNVSETSRKLFVHRNTLVYRLEKIKKLTGLDLREFDDAIIFKVALMVKKYLVSRETASSGCTRPEAFTSGEEYDRVNKCGKDIRHGHKSPERRVFEN